MTRFFCHREYILCFFFQQEAAPGKVPLGGVTQLEERVWNRSIKDLLKHSSKFHAMLRPGSSCVLSLVYSWSTLL
jgi:hypothetical protein